MYMRYRHRRGAYPLAGERTLPRGVRWLLFLGAILLIAYLAWSAVLKVFGLDNSLVRAGALLAVEERGTVNVTIEGQQQRGENGVMLFPGESVSTGAGAHASLLFFDGTRLRLEESSDLSIEKSDKGKRSSFLAVNLSRGGIWILTPHGFSGSVTRTVKTPSLAFDIPPGTEAVITPSMVAVFSAEGEGVQVTLSGRDPFTISEGQQWALPSSGVVSGNVYAHRSPLDPLFARSAFVIESRRQAGTASGSGSSGSRAESSEILTVTAPLNGAIVDTPVIAVRGTVAPGVTEVLINGYPAVLDAQKGTFSQQVSPPDGRGDFEIRVQALDASKAVVAETRRTVRREAVAAIAAPTVTSPARTGETYRTLKEEIVIRGGAPSGAAGIMVNDYKLQLFDPAKGEWSYVASVRLGNMKPGTNAYDVYALDAQGGKSAAARITIIQGEGPEGVVTGGGASSAAGAPSSSGPLPQNDPLLPGSLSVTAPTPGTTHAETGTGFLIEGKTSAQTATIAVNDYTLQLYRAGRTEWNYIADVALNNLKEGRNVYRIVARNAKNEILDVLEYVVDYQPSSSR